MIKIISVCLLALVLTTGCFNRTQQFRDVPVPVFMVPEPPSIERPHLPIHDLTATDRSDVDKVVRAYVVSVKLLLNYSEALRQIVETYAALSRRTDSFWIEPVFTMSLSESRETAPEISELERLRMIAQARQITGDASAAFSQIIESYKETEQEIWREYEASGD